MFELEYILRILNYKILIFNFSYYLNKKWYNFTSNFLNDRDFSNFMRGTGQRFLR